MKFPLGAFRVTENQLSNVQRDRYLSELNGILSETSRRKAFESFGSEKSVVRRLVKAVHFREAKYCIVEESFDNHAIHRFSTVFGNKPAWHTRRQPNERAIFYGKSSAPRSLCPTDDPNDLATDSLIKGIGFIALDKDWQFPAITEQHAYKRIAGSLADASGVLYVGYPWATLIDKIHTKAHDANLHLKRFESFCGRLPGDGVKVTVCQHIYAGKYKHLFQMADITHVFWSHASSEDMVRSSVASEGLFFHPFPLFPVQTSDALPEAAPDADSAKRKYLFSFIGAKANEFYLTNSRNWIFELLAKDSHGLIVLRDHWHYQKVVYDHQIKGTAKDVEPNKLTDASAADQFLISLKESTFSLCPSGTGPNSIRLWESIGAGSIPIILADTWAPPGNFRLWEMAAVFCKEDPDAIRQLPNRLAEIASDPRRISQMRHAMRQLWLLYGPESFITDVQEFVLSHAESPERNKDMADLAAPKGSVLENLLNTENGESLMRHVTSALLLDPRRTLGQIKTDRSLVQRLEKARKDQGWDSKVLRLYDAALSVAERKVQSTRPALPAIVCNAPPKICLFGRHANRTPLSYAPFRRLLEPRLNFVETPEQADIVVSGFNIDLRDNMDSLLPVLKRPNKPKFAILSEEPLWDITWSGPFTGRDGRISANGVEVTYSFLSHETSDIFAFDRIPYFVLTSDSYVVRYANLMGRFSLMKPKDMLERWKRATVPAAFFLEKRTDAMYSTSFPERDVTGLSAYRTEVAESVKVPGVLRVGKGWRTEVRRQDLPDWHLDKLAHTDGRTRVMSGFENVHQRLYITEKVFDAFAVGAIPTYYAGRKHRVFEFVSSASMLNCYDLTPQQAAEKIGTFTPDHVFAEAWLDTVSQLSAIFRDFPKIQADRRRVAEATLKSILEIA